MNNDWELGSKKGRPFDTEPETHQFGISWSWFATQQWHLLVVKRISRAPQAETGVGPPRASSPPRVDDGPILSTLWQTLCDQMAKAKAKR